MNHARRIGLLRRRMSAASVSALLVTHLPDIRYLCGFTGSSAALAVTSKAARLYTDGRYRAQAADEVHAAKVEIVPASPAVTALLALAAQPAVASVAFEPGQVTLAEFDRWKSALPASKRRSFLKPIAPPLVEHLRWIKDADELALMRNAAALGDALFDQLLGFICPGITEIAVAAELEYQARLRGAEAMSFESIVASGPRSALPHGRATTAKLPKRGFLTLDFGVILQGYCSDMTRTICLGKPTPRERAAYEAVLEAQQAGIAAVKAGAVCGQVDEAARSVLRRAGMAEAFSHSTGHGVGLEIHESPRIAAKQTSTLAAGMVITIEPGVYFPGEFGLRIEDMVAVTRSGGEILTHSPTALIQL
jgi:Xaa-Pro aminopeptidase